MRVFLLGNGGRREEKERSNQERDNGLPTGGKERERERERERQGEGEEVVVEREVVGGWMKQKRRTAGEGRR